MAVLIVNMRRSMNRCFIRLLSGILVALCSAAAPCLASGGGDVTIGADKLPELKSAVVVRILQFAQWRGESAGNGTEPLRMGVLGGDKITAALAAHAGADINGRRLEVTTVTSIDDAAHCQVLYISDEDGDHATLVDALDLRTLPGVLSISDAPRFNDDGGIIQLSLENGKLVFTINTNCLEARHLFLSSRLMSVAHVYDDGS